MDSTAPKTSPVRRITYLTQLRQLPQLTEAEIQRYEPVAERFAFRTNGYYNSLIDWSNPDDPLRRLIIPDTEELADWGELDASQEALYQPVQGLEHKYRDTALLLCNDTCGAYCRFCFRKRLFLDDNDEVVKDVTAGIEYIRQHPEINNVLLTGGDPMVMSTERLQRIIAPLCEIEHVRNIRIGTKMLAFNPYRILDDASLLEMLTRWGARKQFYIMAHFNHRVEITTQVVQAAGMLMRTGATILNQTPIIRGVNDKAAVLSDLFRELSFLGIQPYYAFGCRPTAGNKAYAVPVEEAYELFEQARAANSGLAKTARFVMSHRLGKVEVAGLTDELILMKYHNAVDQSLNGKLMVFARNPEAYWFDDYVGRERTLR